MGEDEQFSLKLQAIGHFTARAGIFARGSQRPLRLADGAQRQTV
ncbi:hypothetical protein HNQ08_003032 [Deinococcus humi]|uniref:Uncharacterized protein n=1 Tax=Deinococcus humi TaxID=662880 RepID=A0A7W8JVV3_9DEIO|nr:hypothetical protein [Deinococcus humi]